MSHPDVMVNFGSKDALVKLAGTSLVPEDTYSYYEIISQLHFLLVKEF